MKQNRRDRIIMVWLHGNGNKRRETGTWEITCSWLEEESTANLANKSKFFIAITEDSSFLLISPVIYICLNKFDGKRNCQLSQQVFLFLWYFYILLLLSNNKSGLLQILNSKESSYIFIFDKAIWIKTSNYG